jgi:tetratricopeptide (TPR) repeat protein
MPRYIFTLICCLFISPALAVSSIQELQQQITGKDYSAAAQNGEQLLLNNPGHTWARFLTAYAHQQSNQMTRAIALYEDLISDHPELPEPRNNLALIYLTQGDYDRASQLLVDAINTHPSYATAYENLSRIYAGLASEAYRRAISESSEPAKYTHNIELAAIDRLELLPEALTTDLAVDESTLVTKANLETRLIEQVNGWAKAWSSKDFKGYSGFYSLQHRAKFKSHREWLEYRRQRIEKPGSIMVEITELQIKWISDNRAIIDFKQRFESPGYRDRVVKRLTFSRLGTQWKITEERVLSVL